MHHYLANWTSNLFFLTISSWHCLNWSLSCQHTHNDYSNNNNDTSTCHVNCYYVQGNKPGARSPSNGMLTSPSRSPLVTPVSTSSSSITYHLLSLTPSPFHSTLEPHLFYKSFKAYRMSTIPPVTSVDISAVPAISAWNFTQLLNNEIYTLSQSFVEIYIMPFQPRQPPFSAFQALASPKLCWWLWKEPVFWWREDKVVV